jgi:hypothetical protein
MESEIGAKLGYGVARHPLFRPLARFLLKNSRR